MARRNSNSGLKKKLIYVAVLMAGAVFSAKIMGLIGTYAPGVKEQLDKVS